tara:strand:- start:209 stop:1171 length:963 start_codon:yes stop_codon:yes gene_type:complete
LRVLVTGSTGFVGTVVCQVLLDAGHAVTAAVRGLTDVVPGCRPVVVGNIDGETKWQHALDQIDAVVHLAARTHQDDGEDALRTYQKVNVEGAAQLGRAALTGGVRSFVYMSSIKVNGEYSSLDGSGKPIAFSGEDEPRPTTLYGHTKWRAEQVLSEMMQGSSTRLIILRPPLVYGLGLKANLLRLIRAVDVGVPLPFAGFENPRSLIDVKNLANAVALAVATNCSASGPYTLADIDISIADLVSAIAKAFGSRPRLFRLPVALLTTAALFTGHRDQLNKLTQPLIVERAHIMAAMDWSPQGSLEESLYEIARHYRSTRAK